MLQKYYEMLGKYKRKFEDKEMLVLNENNMKCDSTQTKRIINYNKENDKMNVSAKNFLQIRKISN